MPRLLDLGVVVALAAGVIVAFAGALTAMVQMWGASPMYSYGYTVPVISLFLLWSRRDDFRQRSVRPARLLALPILVLALGMQVVGHVGAIQVLQQLGFLVAIVGIVLFLFGVDYLVVSAPAIAYLTFMVPLWDAFTEPLHWPFQNNSARLGVALMQTIGIPAFREGTFITLPNVLIEVARECSGINYLVAVFALALPLSFLRLRGVWRRILLMAGAMLIAALANGVRVALIGALSYYEVGTPLHGPFHILNGLFVSLVGFIALFVGLRILQPADQPTTAVTEVAQPSNAALRPRWRVHEAFALAVVFWAVVFVGVAPDAVPVALAQPLETVPARLGTWSIDTTSPTAPELEAWNTADDHFRRHYRRSDGQQATVDIWYFKFQSQRREIIGSRVGDLHRLSTPKSVQLANGATLDANAVRWPDTNHVGLFWYDLGGSTESNPYATMLRSLWNVIRAGRNNGAVIMLSAPLKDPSDAGVATALEDLARELQPVLVSVWQIRPRSSN